jgi:hypothetical protein
VFLSLLKDLLNSISIRVIESKLLALERTHAFCCTVCALALDSFQLRASAHQTDTQAQSLDARAQCNFMLDRTSVAIKCTSRLLNSCMLMLDRTVLVLERISAVNNSNQKQLSTKFFIFLVYCYFSLFVYFLVPVFYLFLLLLIFVNSLFLFS